jgi:VWFA-related protein
MGKAAFAVLVLSAYALAQDADHIPTFRSDVALVKVDVQATTASGVNIDDLGQKDFVVYDENQAQEVLHFGSEQEPMSILLLLDVSASMTRSLSAMASATREALAQLHSGDQVALMMFSEQTRLVQPYTDDYRRIREQIVDNMYKRMTGEGTVVNEAIIQAANYVKANAPKGRKAIVVVTDNQSVRSGASDEDVARVVDAAGATMNAILVGAPQQTFRAVRYGRPAPTQPDVNAFARQTGGEAMNSTDVASAFKRIVERIRTRYTLEYSPPAGDAGSFRRIRVDLSPDARQRYPDAVIQARTGYYK